MSQIKLLKDPGYICDLIFLFYLKFNHDMYIESLPDNFKTNNIINYFDNIISQFGDIPDDLFIFSYPIDNSDKTFLHYYCLNCDKDYFTSSYNFLFIQKSINNRENLIRSFIKFYFSDLDDKFIDNCVNSYTTIFPIIKMSDYPYKIKVKLYEFFMDPLPYIQMLYHELTIKEFILSDYYKNNFNKILEIYNDLNINTLNFKSSENYIQKNSENKIIYISFCLLHKFNISYFTLNNDFFYLLGYYYNSIKNNYILYDLGVIFSEQNRINIFNFIIEKNEITCKDLEKNFKISASTAYDHLTLMLNSGILRSYNFKKSIYYKIERNFISNIVSELENSIINLYDN